MASARIQNRLQEIADIAKGIKLLCPTTEQPRPQVLVSPSDCLPTSLRIPLATTITPQLEELGIPPSLTKEISNTYQKAANNLRDTCETSLRNAIHEASMKGKLEMEDVKAIHQAWNATYTKNINMWAKSALTLARNFITRSPKPSKPTKVQFNHEYTPLLETYFEYNAYPSAPDRAVLARKSMMTPRQIEVWFQNHRNRAKKDGKPLRKLASDPLPLKLSLETLEQRMPFFTIPEGERKVVEHSCSSEVGSSDDESEEDPPSTNQVNTNPRHIISNDAPLHAFPMAFPPTCQYEPFPSRASGFKISSPVWKRKPSNLLPSCTLVDFDEFVSEFSSKLSIRDSHSKRRDTPRVPPKNPWFASTHTTPSPAPHPAFIPLSITPTPISLPMIPAIPAPPSRMHPFRSPSPSSHPVMLAPMSGGSGTRRKVARLPRRTPKYPNAVHRGVSPATSEASPSTSFRSLTPSSRASSFSSDVPYPCRPSSSSSVSSTASSVLTTPIFAPTSLPESAPSPISISGIDFQNMDDLFGDSLNPMSSLDGLKLNFSPHTSFNVPTIPGNDIFQFGFKTSTTRLK